MLSVAHLAQVYSFWMVGCLSALFFVHAVLNFFFGIFVDAQFFIIYLFHYLFIYACHVLVNSNVS